MSYVWFQSVLSALGKRINYESVSNLYGNSFAKDAAKLIQSANPLLKNGATPSNAGVMGLMGQIKVVNASSKDASKQALKQQIGDFSWAEGLPI